MNTRNLSLFENERLTLDEARELTRQSLIAYGRQYKHWAIAYSGGKDSTTAATLITRLIELDEVEPPETLTVLYADTRLELPPLQISALCILDELALRGVRTQVVLPYLDARSLFICSAAACLRRKIGSVGARPR